MFLLKSAFWLAVAFVLVKPGFDVNATVSTLSVQAVQTGRQVALAQLDSVECPSIECIGGKAVLAAVLSADPAAPSPQGTMQPGPVPLPRPRPDYAG